MRWNKKQLSGRSTAKRAHCRFLWWPTRLIYMNGSGRTLETRWLEFAVIWQRFNAGCWQDVEFQSGHYPLEYQKQYLRAN